MSENRGPRLNVWLSQDDKDVIKERAAEADLSLSAYLIKVGKGDLVQAVYSREELMIFRNIGANLNQLAGHANRSGAWDTDHKEEVDRLIGQLRNLLS